MASSQRSTDALAASDASQDNCPANTDFRQQRLKAWQPVLTPFYVIATFAAIGILFLPIGFVLLMTSNSVVEYQKRYDQLGPVTYPNPSSVIVNISVDRAMTAPVFVYYGLDNFYQNHRRYVKSRDDLQLAGTLTDFTEEAVRSSCAPMATYTADGSTSSQVLNPCGLIANSMFNDTITLVGASGSGSAASVPTHWTEAGIAWPSDVAYKYGNNPAYQCQEAFNNTAQYAACTDAMRTNAASQRWINQIYPDESVINSTLGVQDEHFIVWMRTAGLPNFRKLYAKLNTNIPAGTTLTFNITQRFDVNSFAGRKYLVVSTTSWLGGKNPFLGYAYIVVGIVCLVLAIAFGAKHHINPRKLGDTDYLVWKDTK